jgi:hypothetical protein
MRDLSLAKHETSDRVDCSVEPVRGLTRLRQPGRELFLKLDQVPPDVVDAALLAAQRDRLSTKTLNSSAWQVDLGGDAVKAG